MIYERLSETGRLDEMDDIVPIKDWSTSVTGGPRMVNIDAECGIITAETQAESKTS